MVLGIKSKLFNAFIFPFYEEAHGDQYTGQQSVAQCKCLDTEGEERIWYRPAFQLNLQTSQIF